jgi:hypothetical protein
MSGNYGGGAFAHIDRSAESDRPCKMQKTNAATDGSLGQHVGMVFCNGAVATIQLTARQHALVTSDLPQTKAATPSKSAVLVSPAPARSLRTLPWPISLREVRL